MLSRFFSKSFWVGSLLVVIIWGIAVVMLTDGTVSLPTFIYALGPLGLLMGVWIAFRLFWSYAQIQQNYSRTYDQIKGVSGQSLTRSFFFSVLASSADNQSDVFADAPVGMRNYGRKLDSIPRNKAALMMTMIISIIVLIMSVLSFMGLSVGTVYYPGGIITAIFILLLVAIVASIVVIIQCSTAKDARIVLCENAIVILKSKNEILEVLYCEDMKCFRWDDKAGIPTENDCLIMLKNGRSTLLQKNKYKELGEKLRNYQLDRHIPDGQ